MSGDDNGINPAWNDVLGIIPEELHEQVTPHFQDWDQSAQSRIESVNKQLEPYKPFIEHDITPAEIEQGLRLMYEINNNPKSVYEALANSFNLGTDGKSEETEAENGDFDFEKHPRFQEMNSTLEALAKVVLNDQQAKQQAAEDAKLEAELNGLKEKYGDFDETYVLAKMANSNMSGEDAVKSFQEMLNQRMQQRPTAPKILGGGNSYPSNKIDPRKLSGQATRDLVAEMLKASAQE